MNLLAKYQERVANTLPAGQGNDFHVYLLGNANVAVKAGISFEQFLADMLSIPHKRRVPHSEIADAYNKAQGEAGTYEPAAQPKAILKDGKATLRGIIRQSGISDEADLWELSPVRLLEES